jgi:phage terminase small subunit
MGLRGPLSMPGSRRSEQETRKQKRRKPSAAVVKRPAMPDWLPAEAAPTWKAVIRDLIGAAIPLERIDGHSIGWFVLCTLEASKAAAAGDAKTSARFGRDALQWAAQIGATPAARLRMNIKPEKPADDGPWERLARM